MYHGPFFRAFKGNIGAILCQGRSKILKGNMFQYTICSRGLDGSPSETGFGHLDHISFWPWRPGRLWVSMVKDLHGFPTVMLENTDWHHGNWFTRKASILQALIFLMCWFKKFLSSIWEKGVTSSNKNMVCFASTELVFGGFNFSGAVFWSYQFVLILSCSPRGLQKGKGKIKFEKDTKPWKD